MTLKMNDTENEFMTLTMNNIDNNTGNDNEHYNDTASRYIDDKYTYEYTDNNTNTGVLG